MPGNTPGPKSGYDVSVYGLNDGSFYVSHLIAISCLSVSTICACATLIMSFLPRDRTDAFYNWQKRERFVVYMAICDTLFSACHLADHANVFAVKNHIHPKELCVFYSFSIFESILAQNLLVNMIAINAFALIYFNYNLNFGRRDWKLMIWIFGLPLVLGITSVATDKFGPNGGYCFFDAVKGTAFYLAMIAIPVIVIMITNMFLYLLTWLKIRTQTRSIRHTIGPASAGLRASQRAAKSMALFVIAYIVQWWALTLAGFWAVTGSRVPGAVVQSTMFFSNIGGLLNTIVWVIIRRSKNDNEENNQNSPVVTISMTSESSDVNKY